MKKLSRIALAIGSTLLCIGTAFSAIPNTDHPTTFVGPTLKGSYTSPLTTYTAYSLAAEAGPRNYRLGATMGFMIDDNQRIKVSAEYLWQKITYAFFSGDSRNWMDQGAIGAGYEYDLVGYNYSPQFDLNAYISHAPSKNLNPRSGFFTNAAGVSTAFTDNRRIAGSDADGITPGISILPWQGGKVGVDLNYDNVRYDNNQSPRKDAKGVGGTIKLLQAITNDIDFGVLAGFRKPFNDYQAEIAWTTDSPWGWGGQWRIGLDGDYVVGHRSLPDTYNVGLSFNYLVEAQRAAAIYKDEVYKDGTKAHMHSNAILTKANSSFTAWTALPAVYMPQVLAVTDDDPTFASCTGGPVSFSGTIANPPAGFGTSTFTIDTASNFSGNNLTYSIGSISPALSGSDSITVNSSTGVVTGSVTTERSTKVYTFTVVATNPCGSATSNVITTTTRTNS